MLTKEKSNRKKIHETYEIGSEVIDATGGPTQDGHWTNFDFMI